MKQGTTKKWHDDKYSKDESNGHNVMYNGSNYTK